MRSRSQIFTQYALAGLFTLFNVGLPIVQYVCPMMRDGGTCECKTVTSKEPALSFPQGDCCNSHVLAERNTTPFLGSGKELAPGMEKMFVLSLTAPGLSQSSQIFQTLLPADTGPPRSPNSVYLLSSPLLI